MASIYQQKGMITMKAMKLKLKSKAISFFALSFGLQSFIDVFFSLK
jgi:hypothetical protein